MGCDSAGKMHPDGVFILRLGPTCPILSYTNLTLNRPRRNKPRLRPPHHRPPSPRPYKFAITPQTEDRPRGYLRPGLLRHHHPDHPHLHREESEDVHG